jgi:ASC-1-like (ASCH) protein
MTQTLHMTLQKQWFDQIAAGTKKTEYREVKSYWTTRLFDAAGRPKPFDTIIFRNGYAPTSPRMRVEFKGLTVVDGLYAIRLGRVLDVTL